MNREQNLITLIIILSIALVGTLVFYSKKSKVNEEKEVNDISKVIEENKGEKEIIPSISSKEGLNS